MSLLSADECFPFEYPPLTPQQGEGLGETLVTKEGRNPSQGRYDGVDRGDPGSL